MTSGSGGHHTPGVQPGEIQYVSSVLHGFGRKCGDILNMETHMGLILLHELHPSPASGSWRGGRPYTFCANVSKDRVL